MADELKKCLQQLIWKTEGLHAIVVTDREGVPLLKVCDDSAPEMSVKPRFLSTLSFVTEQAGKLGLGKNKSVACMFQNFQVVHFNKQSLMVSMIASMTANTGVLFNLDSALNDIVQDLKSAVDVTS